MKRREMILGLGLAVAGLMLSPAWAHAAAKQATVTLEISGMV